ncbi:MAG: hypothetical protein [Bacteriophage sp.]|nr:MAG: hypothetical protein [Bacteriophage sp.]
MSLISWDEADEALETVADRDIAMRAAEALNTLDTTAAKEMLEKQAKEVEDRKTVFTAEGTAIVPAPQPIIGGKLFTSVDELGTRDTVVAQRALDHILKTRDIFELGEAPRIEDKRLINAIADANQLIPFKYMWAWSMYLDSTEKHWMPAECRMENDIADYQALPTSLRKIVSRAIVNYMQMGYIYNSDDLVNMYRLSSAPECRQYLLRQGFEERALEHAMREILEVFEITPEEYSLHEVDNLTWRDRNLNIGPALVVLKTDSFNALGDANIQSFLTAIAVVYGGIRSLYLLVPLYQIWKITQTTGKLSSVCRCVNFILRDLVRQIEYGTRYIHGVLQENPTVTLDQTAIVKYLKILQTANLDLVSTLVVDEKDYNDIYYIGSKLTESFLSEIGLESDGHVKEISEMGATFMTHLKSLNGDHDREVSLAGSDSNGSLNWD